MRFTIRDVLWLMVVVALALGWWLDHRKAQRRFQAIRDWAGIELQDWYPEEMFEDLPAENLKLVRKEVQLITETDRNRMKAEWEEIKRRHLAPGHSSSP